MIPKWRRSARLSKVTRVFKDFEGCCAALIKGLTTVADSAEFYLQCDPADLEGDQALYGFHDGHWKVKVPEEEMPPKLPEPTIIIEVPKDEKLFEEWLSSVAAFSDAWLLFVMSHYAKNLKFSKADRSIWWKSQEPEHSSTLTFLGQLFSMISKLPTVLEVVKEVKPAPAVLNNSSCHPGPNSENQRDSEPHSESHLVAVHPKPEDKDRSALQEERKDEPGGDRYQEHRKADLETPADSKNREDRLFAQNEVERLQHQISIIR
ncbi:PHD finger protein ALFIN-LIKE 4-like [Punica granatum]|uniref:PHD finger protein ALFIN-LIKE n=1 Tax=Punica granatum TaxID=22663 RepID=A0A6P8D4U5_PUNGR|nr:PHD finger protein ALFIN-LIKE 4-like [Punica granatum]